MYVPSSSTRWCTGLLVILLVAVPARAQQPDAAPDTTAASVPAAGLPSRTAVEAFFDGAVRVHLRQHHGAGATVAVVRGDSLVFAKGYGLADVARRDSVRADETLFRVGSISKVFVWTAVMQLVEAGAIDLDADVNRYLDAVQVPATYDEPVTMAHLMTHTAGFEDRVIGLFAEDMSRLRPLDEILLEELPTRVHPPGEVVSYSNHGTALAARVVERVSGLPWDRYVEQHILEPLGMDRTTFRQPVPERLAAATSKGYAFAGGAFVEQGFEFVPLAPVGAASATATDMARFMRAHLNLGRLDDAAILDTATARRMQAPLFTPGPGLAALAHGFYEMSRNGYRVIGHGGDTFWFHSLMALLPAQDVGVFVSFNAAGGGEAAAGVFEAFMDAFFPAPDVPVLEPDAGAPERLERFAGAYRPVRYAHTTIAKVAAAFSQVDVSVTDDGRLRTRGRDETTYWIETGPLSFREQYGLRRLAFRAGEEGRVSHLLLGEVPVMAFERVGWLARQGVQLAIAVVTVFVLLLALFGWPLAAWLRKRHDVHLTGRDHIPAAGRLVAWGAALALVLFVFLLAVGLGDGNAIVYGVPTMLRAAFWLPRLAVLLVAAALLFAAFLWFVRRGRRGARLWYTFVVLAGGVFLVQLFYWNLLFV